MSFHTWKPYRSDYAYCGYIMCVECIDKNKELCPPPPPSTNTIQPARAVQAGHAGARAGY